MQTTDRFPVLLRECMDGKTQEQFCDEMGIEQSHLSRLLSGDRRPGVRTARILGARFPKLRPVLADILLEVAS